MSADDFSLPPAKRQRTESPEVITPADDESDFYGTPQKPPMTAQTVELTESEMTTAATTTARATPSTPPEIGTHIPGLGATEPEPVRDGDRMKPPESPDGILDALLQHVESESRLRAAYDDGRAAVAAQLQTPEVERDDWEEGSRHGGVSIPFSEGLAEDHTESGNGAKITITDDMPDNVGNTAERKCGFEPEKVTNGNPVGMEGAASETSDSADERAVDSTPLAAATATAEEAEWEVDSSPIESSSESDSSDDLTSSDDSDDDDADGDYALLDPHEQARILMEGDGGSDDEGGKSKDKADSAPLRTANERAEEVIPKPDIVVTNEMAIEELGSVEALVESTVVIKAKVSGEYQVLEMGSLLCLKDRRVVGVVSETLGRVEQPMYTVRFKNDEAIQEAGLSEIGTVVYYVRSHSTFVFTQPLKAVKGSDASNFHDEEVGDDEMEFSDDEAEAEHKRQMKMKRQGRRDDRSGRGGRGKRGSFSKPGGYSKHHDMFDDGSGEGWGNGPIEINYDDVGGAEGYTPLVRPPNLHEMMGRREPLEGSPRDAASGSRDQNFRGSRGGARERGRGDRGHRGGGRGRGNWTRPNESRHSSSTFHSNDFSSSSPTFPYGSNPQQHQTSSFSNGKNPYMSSPGQAHPPPPGPFFFSYPQPPPPKPTILPQNHALYANNSLFSPSPTSPLPQQHFGFGFNQKPHPQQPYPRGLPYAQQQTPMLAQPLPSTGSHISAAFLQSFMHNQQQQQQQQHQGNGSGSGSGPGEYPRQQ